MPTCDLEYTIAQIQSGAFSMAAKSHRQEGGNPQLEIDVSARCVVWRLLNLDHGIPEVIPGQPRVDRVDFYFLHEEMRGLRSALAAPRCAHDLTLRLAPLTSQGTERREAKRVRIVAPICRFQPVQRVTVQNRTLPAFDAHARDRFSISTLRLARSAFTGARFSKSTSESKPFIRFSRVVDRGLAE